MGILQNSEEYTKTTHFRITHLQHIYTYHRPVTVGIKTRTVRQASNNEEIEVEATRKNKEIEKRKKDSRQLSCNPHCSFDRAMRVEKTLMQTLACQLSSTLILVWSRLYIALHHLPLLTNLDQQFNSNPKYALHFIPLLKSIIYLLNLNLFPLSSPKIIRIYITAYRCAWCFHFLVYSVNV